MNPKEIFEKIQTFIKDGKFDQAKSFLEEHQDQLGDYLNQAQALISSNEKAGKALDAVKGLFGK